MSLEVLDLEAFLVPDRSQPRPVASHRISGGDRSEHSAYHPRMTEALLTDCAKWDAATPTEQDAVARALHARKLAACFEYEGLHTFDSGEQSHTVAVFEHVATKMRFHLLPGGAVAMGSGPHTERIRGDYKVDLEEDAGTCVVRVEPFLIGEYLVTEYAWARFEGAKLGRYFADGCAIDAVDRADVAAWAERIGARLPTEVEWEYACRAGSDTIFYWGDDPDVEAAWTVANSKSEFPYRTRDRAQQKAPNAFGLLGMIGNLGEWVADDAYPFGSVAGYPSAQPFQVKGDGDGILRGGWDAYDWGFNRTTSRVACALGTADTGCSARVVFGDLLSDGPLVAREPIDPTGVLRELRAQTAARGAAHVEKPRIEIPGSGTLVSSRRFNVGPKPKLYGYRLKADLFPSFFDFAKGTKEEASSRAHYHQYFADHTRDIDRDLDLPKGTAQRVWRDYLEGVGHEGLGLLYWSLADMLGRSFFADSLKQKGWTPDDKRAVVHLGEPQKAPSFCGTVAGLLVICVDPTRHTEAREAAGRVLSKSARKNFGEWLDAAAAQAQPQALQFFLVQQ